MYYGREWSGVTPENFIQHVDAYIRRYNERRIELSLEALSPEMYRRRLRIIILKQSRILAWRERSFGNSRSPSPEYAKQSRKTSASPILRRSLLRLTTGSGEPVNLRATFSDADNFNLPGHLPAHSWKILP